jgi:hypothetical protein
VNPWGAAPNIDWVAKKAGVDLERMITLKMIEMKPKYHFRMDR